MTPSKIKLIPVTTIKVERLKQEFESMLQNNAIPLQTEEEFAEQVLEK